MQEGDVALVDVFNLQFCIWGTGKYGKLFINKIVEYSNICKHVFNIDILENINYFIDNDIEKQKQDFYCKPVKSPSYFYADTVDICAIATVRGKEIKMELEENGKKDNLCCVTWRQMIKEYKKELLKKRDEVLEKFNFTVFDENIIIDFNEMCLTIKRELENLFKDEWKTDKILRFVVFSVLIDYWKKSANKEKDFFLMREYFNDTFIVAAFAWYYGDDIAGMAEWFEANVKLCIRNANKKQTIGLVIDRYFGGGIEKVVSSLLPLYVNSGHKVVLITDNFKPEVEYIIPQEVIRHVMHYSAENDVQERLDELVACAEENHIDIMCFHSGYTRIATFYEMLRLKLQNIAVLMEVHSAFLSLITEHKDIAKSYAYMYMMADRLIVLSNVDRLFWKNLGCNCTYIQNPMEERTGKKVNINVNSSPIIVWVGRLVQTPKRVFDTIPIMKEVIKKIPDAKLRIVGSADEQWVYQLLIKKIEENDLKNNIELCDYKSDADEIYGEADIALITSSSESFCNVIMESKIRGIPIVMYELPWLELLRDGKGYVAVEQGNTKAAATEIVKLLCEEEWRKRMAVDSRKSIEFFMTQDVYLKWKQVFDDVISIKNKKISVGSEYTIIERLLLTAICDN